MGDGWSGLDTVAALAADPDAGRDLDGVEKLRFVVGLRVPGDTRSAAGWVPFGAAATGTEARRVRRC